MRSLCLAFEPRRSILMIYNMSPGHSRPTQPCAAMDEHRFREIAIGEQHSVQLVAGQRRNAVIAGRHVSYLKTRRLINAHKVRVRVEAEVLVIEQANDRSNAVRLSGLDPALNLPHAYWCFAFPGIPRACRAIEFLRNNWCHHGSFSADIQRRKELCVS